METESANTTHWRSNILIILAVLGAILLALILAQLDSLNELISPLPTAVAGIPSGSGGTDGQEVLPPTPLPSLTPQPTNTNTPAAADATATLPPTATPTSIPGQCNNTPANWIPYVVQHGDTLYSLSIRSGASMEAIIHANCLESEHLITGTVIYLPATPPVLPPCGPPSYWIVYTVQYGDTLYSLANRTGTTVYSIMRANCLYNTYIYAGQQLYLPTYPAVTPTSTPPATMLPTATGTVTSTPPMTTTVTATPTGTGTLMPTTTATPTATATGTLLPTATGTMMPTANPTGLPTSAPTGTANPTAAPTVTSTGVPTLAPPTATSMPTAYPPGPSPTVPPPPTAYP